MGVSPNRSGPTTDTRTDPDGSNVPANPHPPRIGRALFVRSGHVQKVMCAEQPLQRIGLADDHHGARLVAS